MIKRLSLDKEGRIDGACCRKGGKGSRARRSAERRKPCSASGMKKGPVSRRGGNEALKGGAVRRDRRSMPRGQARRYFARTAL